MTQELTFVKVGEPGTITVTLVPPVQVVVVRHVPGQPWVRLTDGRFGGRDAAADAVAYWQVRVARLHEQGWRPLEKAHGDG